MRNSSKERTIKQIVIFLCLFIIGFNILIGYTNPAILNTILGSENIIVKLYGMGNVGRSYIGIIALIIIALCSSNNPIKKVEWKWFVVALWMFGSALIIITGIFHVWYNIDVAWKLIPIVC